MNNDNNKIIKDKIIKKRKKRKNIKKEIAEKNYISPRSNTFLNKKQSMIRAGYSENYAKTDGNKLLDNISLTDINLSEFDTFISDIPSLSSIIKKRLKELKKGDMKAKDFANIIRYLELLAKFAGIIKQTIEKKSINVNIDIPISKCPKCGYVMDIMKEG